MYIIFVSRKNKRIQVLKKVYGGGGESNTTELS